MNRSIARRVARPRGSAAAQDKGALQRNWLRTLPYVRAWAEKYKDQGLVVIGVHTAEFEFEKNLDNVWRAVRDIRVARRSADER